MGGLDDKGDEDERTRGPDPQQRWVFPGRLPGDVPAEISDDEDDDGDHDLGSRWVVLRSMSSADADAAIERLERHGLPCRLSDETERGEPSEAAATETVRVRAEDFGQARQILDRPVEEDLAESEAEVLEIQREIEAVAVDGWVCPRCDRATLEALPLSGGWRAFRRAWFAVLLAPLLSMLVLPVLPLKMLERVIAHVPGRLFPYWLAVVAAMAAALWTAHRDKRCVECSWSSRTGEHWAR